MAGGALSRVHDPCDDHGLGHDHVDGLGPDHPPMDPHGRPVLASGHGGHDLHEVTEPPGYKLLAGTRLQALTKKHMYINQGCLREVIKKKEELHFVANLTVNYRYR